MGNIIKELMAERESLKYKHHDLEYRLIRTEAKIRDIDTKLIELASDKTKEVGHS